MLSVRSHVWQLLLVARCVALQPLCLVTLYDLRYTFASAQLAHVLSLDVRSAAIRKYENTSTGS